MDSIRVKNLRSIKDSKIINLKPLTLLVGRNGSGKSTITRLFPLLRQSVEAKTKGPILWYGDYVDFGGFKESIFRNSSENEIILETVIKPLKEKSLVFYPIGIRHRKNIEKLLENSLNIGLSLAMDEKEGGTFVKEARLYINNDNVSIRYNNQGEVERFYANDLDILKEAGDFKGSKMTKTIPAIIPKKIENEWQDFRSVYRFMTPYLYLSPGIAKAISSTIRGSFHGGTNEETIMKFVRQLFYDKEESFLNNIKEIRTGGEVWNRNLKRLKPESFIIKKVRNLLLAGLAGFLFFIADETFSENCKNIRYIGPLRASAERYYRVQEFAVGEVDNTGKNLAMYLRNLSDSERIDLKRWTFENLGFEVNAIKEGYQIALIIKESGSDLEFNLTDMGFGFSQIIPIIVQLWSMATGRIDSQLRTTQILAIEQPELHLHPNFQAMIADLFANAVRLSREKGIDLKIIIETHSETIINRIGSIIFDGKLDNNDVNLIIFEKMINDKSTSVTFSKYNSSGYLENWPYGFFQPSEG